MGCLPLPLPHEHKPHNVRVIKLCKPLSTNHCLCMVPKMYVYNAYKTNPFQLKTFSVKSLFFQTFPLKFSELITYPSSLLTILLILNTSIHTNTYTPTYSKS